MNLPLNIFVASILVFILFVQVQADVTRCIVQGDSTKCTFDPSQLNLGTGSVLQLLDTKGEIVECDALATDNGWYGEQCSGNARDANFIQRKDHNGLSKVFGSIRIGSDICRIIPNANGTNEMTCTPETDFPSEAEGIVPHADSADEAYNAHVRNLHVGFDPTHPIGVAKDVHGRMLYDDSGSTIDVLVVWTEDAECVNSGLLTGCTLTATTESNMRGLIDLAIEETNTAYSLSGMLSSLRLVHAYRDSTYVEPATFDIALDNLSSISDGKLDSVHALRTLYGADMVQMVTSLNTYCGMAYLSSSKASVFAVISYGCMTGYYSYAHEVGHNFEMQHDRGTDDACAVTGYNFGYRSPTADFRSILAYGCATGQCDNMPKNGCTRVQRFSNNQTLYNGQAIGDANNNNALQFNNLRATIAAHFPAMNCQSNNQCNDNDVNTVDTCNVAKAICVFTPSPPTPSTPVAAPTPASSPTVPTPVVVPTAQTPVDSPIVSTPVSAPTVPTPVVVPTASTPVDSPTVSTPVSTPTIPTPVVMPTGPTPVDSPTASTPVSAPTVPTPVVVPTAPTPVDPPTVETPVDVASPGFTVCGLFGFSLFCPFTLCGFFGRLLGFCWE